MELERVVAITAFVNLAIAVINFQTAKLNNRKAKALDEKEKDTTPEE